MDTSEATSRLHSVDYFGEQRDFWWNRDFVSLLAGRCALSQRREVLDVGAGQGHWTRVLLEHLPSEARIRGVDAQPEWVQKANAWAESAGLGGRVRCQHARAEQLPFSDGAFDLVTCQTLLIHLADPMAGLKEMLRVLRPGGLLLLAEPNNLAHAVVGDSVSRLEPLETRLALVRFQAVCERGKVQLGEGDNSVGDHLAGMLAAVGVSELRVWLSDRATPLTPPYASPAERALAKELVDFADRGYWIWDREQTRAYFLAGGGDESELEALWKLAMSRVRAIREAVTAGTYASGGGGVMYVLAATR